MKADIKALWVADLRANPDAQGRSLLDYIDGRGNRKNCCLGRLCRLAVAAGATPAPELHDNEYRYLDDRDLGRLVGEGFNQATALPRKVAKWAGLDGDDDVTIMPADEDGGDRVTAIEANDGMRMSFAEIADLIHKNGRAV
jgi:hypothetical protein